MENSKNREHKDLISIRFTLLDGAYRIEAIDSSHDAYCGKVTLEKIGSVGGDDVLTTWGVSVNGATITLKDERSNKGEK